MKKPAAAAIGVLILLILASFNTMYTVGFHEVAIKTRFGKIQSVVTDPGQHWKMPFFIERVSKLDTRLQLLNSSEDAVATKDAQQVIVQAFLLWRVDRENIANFFGAYGSVAEGAKILEGQLQSALRGGIGKFEFDQLIGEGGNLQAAESAILAELKKNNLQGVELSSVGISQVVLPAKTTVAVLRRMEAKQRRIANAERTAGVAEADGVRAQATSSADKIRLFASDRASQIKGKGDKEAAQFYQTMKEAEPLAVFLAWLRAFESSLGSKTTFIADTTRPPMHLLDSTTPIGPDGIPLPSRDWTESATGQVPANAAPVPATATRPDEVNAGEVNGANEKDAEKEATGG